jgi:hypothetical protein
VAYLIDVITHRRLCAIACFVTVCYPLHLANSVLISPGRSLPSGLTRSSSSGSISLLANVSPSPTSISSYLPSLNTITVYVNSLLAVLNSRETLRKRTAGMTTIPQSPESIQPHKMNFITTSSIIPSPPECESPSISKPQNVGGSLTDLGSADNLFFLLNRPSLHAWRSRVLDASLRILVHHRIVSCNVLFSLG